MSERKRSNSRVVITGAGAFCPIGQNVDEFWENCVAGTTNVKPIPAHWAEYSKYNSKYWSPLPELGAIDKHFTRVQRLTLDPCARLAILSVREALENAGFIVYRNKNGDFRVKNIAEEQTAVFMGTGVGGISSLLQNHTNPVLSRNYEEIEEIIGGELRDEVKEKLLKIIHRMVHARRINPFIVSMLMPNAVSANIGLLFGLKGPNRTYATACAAGTVAIGQAFKAVQNGEVSVAIAGGAEYLNDDYGYIFRGFDVSGTLAKGDDPDYVNRPFDEARNGFLLSQGAAATMILEDIDHANQRKAPIVAEISGYGESFDAYNIMQMGEDTSQVERMTLNAISDADLKVEDIDYINAHGTGTINNDEIEAKIIGKLFCQRPLVNSTKSLVGHTIGASGALEAIVTAYSLKNQTTHVCNNLERPNSDLNFVRDVRSFNIRHALTQSFAFGGHNSAIVLRKFDG